MQGQRKYDVKVEFFSEWTHEMAYILGFVTADGNIYQRTLTVDVHPQDREVLEFIRQSICPEAKIEFRRGLSCRLRINSVELVKSLGLQGVVPRKSKIIEMPVDVPDLFFGSYLRGVFDGDGWVYLRRNSIESGIVSGSEMFIDQIHSRSGLGKIREQRKAEYSPVYVLVMYKRDTLALRNLIYEKDCFSLARKKQKMFSDFYVRSSRWWTETQIKMLKDNWHLTISNLSELLGKTEKSVNLMRWRLSNGLR